ncbi:3661_t:CDS:2, partial [Acaulospora colombiana]
MHSDSLPPLPYLGNFVNPSAQRHQGLQSWINSSQLLATNGRDSTLPPLAFAGLLGSSVQVALACKAEANERPPAKLAEPQRRELAPKYQYEVRSQLVVTEGFQPTDSVYPYFSVTKFWRKAIKTELQRLNNHSEDLREHAWALGGRCNGSSLDELRTSGNSRALVPFTNDTFIEAFSEP